MTLPNEPGGFAVNVGTGVVHKRHAPDAVNLRRTTLVGVYSLLGDTEPQLCETCFPPPPAKPATAKPAIAKPKTRSRFTAQPVKVIEPDLSAETLYADTMAQELAETRSDDEESDGED
jgi:hypothetical protein